MTVNGTQLINNPWDTIFSPFTGLFGQGFWLFPITFIAVALFIKTRDPTITGLFMTASGLLFGSAMFTNYPEMGAAYFLFATIGIISSILGIYFMKQ